MDDLMPIGEFSELSGLSLKRLRSYAADGLLVPAAVDSHSGYRFYAPGQLRNAQVIDALREAGMPLANIAVVLRDPSDARLNAWADHVDHDADQRREALASARRLLALTTERDDKTPLKGQNVKTLVTASRTDIGLERDNNEDSIAVHSRLVVVADGMGGAPGGEVAASIATELVEASFVGSAAELSAGVRAANRAIWQRAHSTDGLEGMGSTICAVGLTSDGILSVVNVGDSRAYLLHDGQLEQLTEDHTVSAELVRRGELAETDAASHPHRHVLTRVLGVGPSVEADVFTRSLSAGDRLLVCTDGLFNEVPEDEIAAAMAKEDIDLVAESLVERARAAGARDNVTVAVSEVRD